MILKIIRGGGGVSFAWFNGITFLQLILHFFISFYVVKKCRGSLVFFF